MITCKEDLVNTYIENDNGVLRDVYVSLCNLHGVNIISKLAIESESIIEVTLDSCGECSAFTPSRHNLDNDSKQLTLTDLLPTSYENTKVYSLDEDVIRKYAELCSYPEEVITGSSSIGIFIDDGFFAVRQFERNSQVDALEEFTTLTPEQILAAWDLRVGEEKTRTESEYQAAVNSRDDLQREVDSIEGLVKENTMNAEKLSIANQRISELESLKQDKQPLRTKVEYVKCEIKDAVVLFLETNAELYAEPDESQKYDGLQDFINNMDECGSGSLYRRTEVEIDWRDELRDFIELETHNGGSFFKYDLGDNEPLSEVGISCSLRTNRFIAMCHLVSSLTPKP